MAEVRPFLALVSAADLRRVRVVAVRREPALDGLPVERLVAVPVVLRRGDDRDDRQAGRLEDETVPSRVVHGSSSVLVVVRKREPPPVRLADDDVAAGTNRRDERVDGVRKAAVDEARAEAERGVVRLRLERRAARRRRARRRRRSSSPAVAARSTATAWKSGEISTPCTLHPNSRARRSAGPPRPDAMSRTRDSRPEAEPLAEQQELLLGGRVLELVHRLGDDVVARDHGAII